MTIDSTYLNDSEAQNCTWYKLMNLQSHNYKRATTTSIHKNNPSIHKFSKKHIHNLSSIII